MLRFNHFNLRVPREKLASVLDFYAKVFDWREGYRPLSNSEGAWLYQGDVAMVHLSLVTDAEAAQFNQRSTGYLDHIAFHTDQLEQMKAKLDALAVDYSEVTLASAELTQLFFFDPMGLRLEING